MPRKEKLAHALFVRWRDVEIGAFGIPAIFAVIVLTVVFARWCGVL
jgi:hypothetical protein